MTWNANGGYHGYSMSNNAVMAYEFGEKPASKWTKADMVAEVEACAAENDIAIPKPFYKLTRAKMFFGFFHRTSWHHTSKCFNETDFYSLNEDAVIENIDAAIEHAIAYKYDKAEKPAIHKGKITYEVWEGSRKHGKFVKYEEYCLLVGDWAYTEYSKKNMDGAHVLHVERYERAPKGTAETFRRIYKKLPKSAR